MISALRTAMNLAQPLIERAGSNPDQLCLVFLLEDGQEQKITAQEFHRQAQAFAGQLKRMGIKPDDLVVLVMQHSLDLLYAFWGAIYLGAIPSIFPFLTEKLDPDVYFERVHSLIKVSEARAAITTPEFAGELQDLLVDVDCRVLSTVDVYRQDPPEIELLQPAVEDPQRIAFLQHSSGTTGLQKGVALSHKAVLNQIEAYARSIQISTQDVVISWLPLYHDMGLIAGFVMPLVLGVPLVLISPFHWVRDPKTLFKALHTYRGSLCWLPNFAYNHSMRAIRMRDLSGLDFSHVRMLINCSEPVRYDSHRLFLERFSSSGIRAQSLAACYAMAENTFAVTQTIPGQPAGVDWVDRRSIQEQQLARLAVPGSAEAHPFVSCGEPVAGTEVIVAGPGGLPLPERAVGEIALRGSSMLSGYYHRPDLTAEAIREGWYYTGDLGYLADGQLYITGRKKDLIIVGGKNIFPQDLEAIANQVLGIYPGRAVAFGVFDERVGTEGVVMVCELEKDCDEVEMKRIELDLRHRVVQQSEITLSDVRLVERRWILKTSSGKLARSANRDKYQQVYRLQ
jgi:fatty-acyl-CoA synthase